MKTVIIEGLSPFTWKLRHSRNKKTIFVDENSGATNLNDGLKVGDNLVMINGELANKFTFTEILEKCLTSHRPLVLGFNSPKFNGHSFAQFVKDNRKVTWMLTHVSKEHIDHEVISEKIKLYSDLLRLTTHFDSSCMSTELFFRAVKMKLSVSKIIFSRKIDELVGCLFMAGDDSNPSESGLSILHELLKTMEISLSMHWEDFKTSSSYSAMTAYFSEEPDLFNQHIHLNNFLSSDVASTMLYFYATRLNR